MQKITTFASKITLLVMVFSSNIFLLYFLPAFLLIYFIVPKKFRNITLLIFSIIFYAYGAPDFILLLLGSTIANFYLVNAMYHAKTKSAKNLFCTLAVIISMGLLAYFKYANFFIENINSLLALGGKSSIHWSKILLPIGISFFSFQSVTYVIDTYRGVNKPMDKITDYILYIIMFPQLIAGPIVRYCDISNQITQRETRWNECLQGFYRFVIGLSKKILIADLIGSQVDIFLSSDYATMSSATAWIAILAYTMQLYFDFAGYSDMAIGLGRIMGFRFPENFDNPYVSSSISEFWRRWHQTLGIFMKNYLYIPLGGNRVSKSRIYFNLWVVFLLSGLWHGASWNFVIWGAYHGFFLVCERLFLNKFYKTIGKIPSMIITFIIVMVGWAIFRIEDIAQCELFISRLFAFDFSSLQHIDNPQFYFTLVIALFFSFLTISSFGRKIQDFTFYTDYTKKQHSIVWPLSILLWFFCISALNATGFSPFIYFRF